MSYEVAIVADSISPAGARITTFQLKYPRMIHAEVMTHRMFSRNASSTRAIPTAKMIERIEKDPAMPVYWGKNQKGMQANEELNEEAIEFAKIDWLVARDNAIESAKFLMDLGVHKQIVSRILEPWSHINVVLTGTSFDNFFTLRCHTASMPEMQVLAVKMARAYRDSIPSEGLEYHLPFVSPEDLTECSIKDCFKFSVARSARTSYLTFEGKPADRLADIALHDQLQANGHWSPFEHPAQRCHQKNVRSGNFQGWEQYRSWLPVNVHDGFDFAILDRFDDRDFLV